MLLLPLIMSFYVFELRFGVGCVSDACVVGFANKSLPFWLYAFYWLKD